MSVRFRTSEADGSLRAIIGRIAAADAGGAAEAANARCRARVAGAGRLADARLVRIDFVVDAVLRRREVGHDHVRPAHQPQLAAALRMFSVAKAVVLGMFARGHASRARAITL